MKTEAIEGVRRASPGHANERERLAVAGRRAARPPRPVRKTNGTEPAGLTDWQPAGHRILRAVEEWTACAPRSLSPKATAAPAGLRASTNAWERTA